MVVGIGRPRLLLEVLKIRQVCHSLRLRQNGRSSSTRTVRPESTGGRPLS